MIKFSTKEGAGTLMPKCPAAQQLPDKPTEESKLVNGEELKPMPTGFKAVLMGQNATRFRVYDLPDGKWMNNLFDRLNNI